MVPTRLGLMGSGQMGSAMAAGIVRAGLAAAESIWAYDPSPAALVSFQRAVPGARVADSPVQLAEQTDAVLVAVKPQHARQACAALCGRLDRHLVLSVVAGVSLSQLENWLGTNRIIRIMPNTACLVGHGASAFAPSPTVHDEEIHWVERLLQAVGWAVRVPESLLDAVTGLSGSGPAYVAVFIEALADGGVRAGLPRATAYGLALHTVRGAAELLRQTDRHPAQLKDQVASPGGTTIAGLAVLEERGFRGAVIQAVTAATERARQLGTQADSR